MTNKHFMSKIFLIFSLLLLSLEGLAWGPEIHRYICHNITHYFFGDLAVKCLKNFSIEDQKDICEKVAKLNESLSHRCLKKDSLVDVANIPLLLFNDTWNHYYYGKCPIKSPALSKIFCDMNDNPAEEVGNFWLSLAKEEKDVCKRSYYLCLASFYLSHEYMPGYHTKYTNREDVKRIEEIIDLKVKSKKPWYQSFLIEFRKGNRVHTERYWFGDRYLSDMIRDLIEKFENFGIKPEITRVMTTVTITTVTSTTLSSTTTSELEIENISAITDKKPEPSGILNWWVVFGCILFMFVIIVLIFEYFYKFRKSEEEKIEEVLEAEEISPEKVIEKEKKESKDEKAKKEKKARKKRKSEKKSVSKKETKVRKTMDESDKDIKSIKKRIMNLEKKISELEKDLDKLES